MINDHLQPTILSSFVCQKSQSFFSSRTESEVFLDHVHCILHHTEHDQDQVEVQDHDADLLHLCLLFHSLLLGGLGVRVSHDVILALMVTWVAIGHQMAKN